MRLGEGNFSSYANVESFENFSNPDEVKAYRERRLKRYEEHAEFITRYLSLENSLKDVSVLEVGSGSSGLLYSLNKRIPRFKAYGVEISSSRWKFAEAWKKDENIKNIENLNQDFSKLSTPISELNAYIVIDNTFSYLAPENSEYPELLVKTAFSSLAPKGFILIDVINYSERMKKGSETFWSQFPDTDPFKYGLYSFEVVDQQTVVTKSVFIKRNFTEEVKVDVSHFYSEESLKNILKKNGFKVEGVFGSFKGDSFQTMTSPRLIMIARKPE